MVLGLARQASAALGEGIMALGETSLEAGSRMMRRLPRDTRRRLRSQWRKTRFPATVAIGGGSVAAIGYLFAGLSESSSSSSATAIRRHNPWDLDGEGEEAACARLGLMAPREAQFTSAVRVQNFLSADELAELLDKTGQIRDAHRAGQLERNSAGRPQAAGVWRTTYLHTDGMFHDRLADFEQRLVRAIREVDAANWRLLAGRDPAKLNLRTVELHDYGPGGELKEPGHYDAGSLITVDLMLAKPGEDFQGGAIVMPREERPREETEERLAEARGEPRRAGRGERAWVNFNTRPQRWGGGAGGALEGHARRG